MRRLSSLLAFFPLFCSAATLRMLDGNTLEGKMALEAGGKISVTPASAPATIIDLANVLEAGFLEKPAAPFSRGVILKNGEWLAGEFEIENDTSVKLKKRNVSVPRAAIARLVYQQAKGDAVLPLRSNQTGVIFPNGDFFEGEILGMSKGAIKINSLIFGVRSFGDREVQAAVMGGIEETRSQYAVQTTDGSEFFVDLISSDKDAVTFKHALLGELKIKGDELARIVAGKGRALPLATLKPIRVDSPKGVEAAKAWSIDKSLYGDPLAIAGGPIAHGMEIIAGASISYSVPAGLTGFVSQMGVSEKIPATTPMTFIIFADARPVFRSAPLKSTDKAQVVRFNFGNAQTITLRVEPGVAASGIFVQPTLLNR